jgi:hypothetical protein
MKNRLLSFLLLLVSVVPAAAQDDLQTRIKNKEWAALAVQFSDQSHQQLAAYFKDCLGVGFNVLRRDELMFFARFRDVAEIGEITYELENGKYRQLSLKRSIKPLLFVDGFARYDLADRTLRLGDAEIYFKKGVVYQGMPLSGLFVFCGEWRFTIKPSSAEERLTLLDQLRDDTFDRVAQTGVFFLSQADALGALPSPTRTAAPDDAEAQLLYESFQQKWGMHIPFFNELWYFPFAPDFNSVIFFRKPGKSYYRYVFNSGSSPDTSLVMLPENKFLLNYNAITGLKFTGPGTDELENLQLNLFFNPQVPFLSATAVLNFKEPSSVKTVSLGPGLVLKGYGKSQQHELQLFNRGDTYFLLGPELNKFSFYYAGNIGSSDDAGEMTRVTMNPAIAAGEERYFILSRDQDFYPNPGHHFFKNRVKISLPHPLQCLASGELRSQKKTGERSEFVFESPGSKGVSLVCGNFVRLLTIPGPLPLHIHGHAKLKVANYFKPEAIAGIMAFLLDKYGPLDIAELNLLLRRRKDYGGLSNQGFVVFNLKESGFMDDELSVTRLARNDSPVVFGDVNRDNLVHELAHQWWGGVVSWKSYQDQWLTEGLAQFSTLLYLQHSLPESQFRRAVASAKRWVLRSNDAGPVIYGRRIANLSNDLNTYQSIVYNKSALVFLMLREILGEDEMLKRLRQVLDDFKYQSLATARFIQQLGRDEPRLEKFFRGWVYARPLPEVRWRSVVSGQMADVTFEQLNGDFVFPVALKVTTSAGVFLRQVIVEEKTQKFTLNEKSDILQVEVDPGAAPIRVLN